MSSPLSPTSDGAGRARQPELPISPLAGEMPGRAEGGLAPTFATSLAKKALTPAGTAHPCCVPPVPRTAPASS
ncbi:MAG: hypothetical protein E5W04_32105, partial [Mesorhizobium sp.]